jgi:ComF family protein
MPNPNLEDNQQALTIICGECIATPPPFVSTVASFRYDIPINKAIQLLKYNRKQYFATLLANCLATTVLQKYQNAPLPCCLIPVPMHKVKLKSRGFNQAQLISQKVSRSLSIPNNSTILKKIRSTPSQTGLNKQQRTRNLKGAFHLTDTVAGQHIALVDDVVTTRATSDLLCQLLLDAGAKRVDVWCIARTEKFRR